MKVAARSPRHCPWMLNLASTVLLLGLALPATARTPRLDVGLRLDALSLSRAGPPTDSYGGMGVMARYRHSNRWGFEMAMDVLSTDLDDGTSRNILQLDTGLLFFFWTGPYLEFYAKGGFGSLQARWYDPETETELFQGGGLGAHLGVGGQLKLGAFTLFSDLRAQVVVPIHNNGSSDSGSTPPQVVYLRHPDSEYTLSAAQESTHGSGEDGDEESSDPSVLGGVMFTMGISYGW
jgi:hypothetical protein